MVEAVIHFLIHIGMVFPKLADRICLYLLDAILLPLELIVKLLRQVRLPLQTTLLLRIDGVFYFVCLLLEQLEYFPLFLDASVSLRLQVLECLLDASVYWVQL